MPDSLTLIIAGDAAELSPNKRMGWRQRCRLVRAWRERAIWYWLSAGAVFVGERVVIAITVRRGRAQDADNAASSLALKAICDGLSGKAFPDDDAAHVRFAPIVQETGREWARSPEVVVVIRPDETAADPSASPAAGARSLPERPDR